MSDADAAITAAITLRGDFTCECSKLEVVSRKGEGNGMVVNADVEVGEVLVRLPFRLLMSKYTAMRSELGAIVPEDIAEDELLALHLILERSKGEQSDWHPYIRRLPTHYDNPFLWDEEDLQELEGTNVHLLTQMMKNQVQQDWKSIHLPIIQQNPSIFGKASLTESDYAWALASIWSRAFGVERPLVDSSNSESKTEYIRVLVPYIDMLNHRSSAKSTLDDSIRFVGEHLELTAAEALKKGEDMFLNYGHYTNAKLCYSYGFVQMEGNPHRGYDMWFNVPPSDPNYSLKQSQLMNNPLTAVQFSNPYDFTGTIHGDSVSQKLLATLRMILLQPAELPMAWKVFQGRAVSARNELAVYKALASACSAKLDSFSSTIAEDEEKLQAHLQEGEKWEVKASAKWHRRLCALQVRLEDKHLLQDTANTLHSMEITLKESSS